MKMPSRLFGLSVALAIVWIYMFMAVLEVPKDSTTDPAMLRAAALKTATGTLADIETRSAAAQAYCGNAGWKISDDNKTLTCIPRHGKPYIAKAAP